MLKLLRIIFVLYVMLLNHNNFSLSQALTKAQSVQKYKSTQAQLEKTGAVYNHQSRTYTFRGSENEFSKAKNLANLAADQRTYHAQKYYTKSQRDSGHNNQIKALKKIRYDGDYKP